MRYPWLIASRSLERSKCATRDRTAVAEVIGGEDEFSPIVPVQLRVFNNCADHAKECLAKSFSSAIHLRIPRLGRLPHDPMVGTIDIKSIILIFPTIVSTETTDPGLTMLVASLVTFESGKGITFRLNNLDFRALSLIIQKGNKVFTPIIAARRNRAADIAIN